MAKLTVMGQQYAHCHAMGHHTRSYFSDKWGGGITGIFRKRSRQH
jgi:hypothetical protein